jgi:hypothetical protein
VISLAQLPVKSREGVGIYVRLVRKNMSHPEKSTGPDISEQPHAHEFTNSLVQTSSKLQPAELAHFHLFMGWPSGQTMKNTAGTCSNQHSGSCIGQRGGNLELLPTAV